MVRTLSENDITDTANYRTNILLNSVHINCSNSLIEEKIINVFTAENMYKTNIIKPNNSNKIFKEGNYSIKLRGDILNNVSIYTRYDEKNGVLFVSNDEKRLNGMK